MKSWRKTNQNQNYIIDQAIKRMKQREHSNPLESQTYTRISYDNVLFKINPHMLQFLPTFYGRFNEEIYEFLEEFIYICTIHTYPIVSKRFWEWEYFL